MVTCFDWDRYFVPCWVLFNILIVNPFFLESGALPLICVDDILLYGNFGTSLIQFYSVQTETHPHHVFDIYHFAITKHTTKKKQNSQAPDQYSYLWVLVTI